MPSIVSAVGETATIEVSERPTLQPGAWTGLRVEATVELDGNTSPPGPRLPLRLTLDARRRAADGDPEERVSVADALLLDRDTVLFVAPRPVRPDGPRFGVLATVTVVPPPVTLALARPTP
jgi:hypothetical protein